MQAGYEFLSVFVSGRENGEVRGGLRHIINNFLTLWNVIIHKPDETKDMLSFFIWEVHSYTQDLFFPEPE